MQTPAPTHTTEPTPGGSSRLWLWFVAAFALQLVVWTAWFILAAHHPVEEIPVPPRSAR